MALIVGSVLGFKFIQAGAWDVIVIYYVPGLVLTIALHVFWESYKKQYLGPYFPEYNKVVSGAPGGEETAPPRSGESTGSSPRARLRRRSRSRRSPRR